MDIHHLKQISDVESHTIFVDSSLRNKKVHPTPSEYEIEFSAPLQNVVGMDILDASIPATLFVVDTHNNKMALSVRLGGLDAASNAYSYFASTPLSESFDRLINRTDRVVYIKYFHENGGLDALLEQAVAPDPPDHLHYVVAKRSAASSPVESAFRGAGVNLSAARYRFSLNPASGAYDYTDLDTGVALPAPVNSSGLVIVEVAGTPRAVRGASLAGMPTWSREAEVSLDGTLTSVWVVPVQASYYSAMESHYHEIRQYLLETDIGDHDTDSLVQAFQYAVPKQIDEDGNDDNANPYISLRSASVINPGNFLRNRRIVMQSLYPFWFDMSKSTMEEVLGFTIPSGRNLADGRHMFVSAKSSASDTYEILSPGLINLFGERFATLRCPQIENQYNSSLSYNAYSAGIGVFKLYDMAISHLRFDFNKYRKHEFHPIGKLPRLKFRFERRTGELYDFKGIDHHMFIALHFLKPRNTTEVPSNCLNPDYNPDVLQYIVQQKQELDESDTESDGSLMDDEIHMRRFMHARAEYMRRAGRDAY